MAATLTTPTQRDAPPTRPPYADSPRLDPADTPGAFAYEDADAPDGMTIADRKRGRAHRHARRRRHRLRRRRSEQSTE